MDFLIFFPLPLFIQVTGSAEDLAFICCFSQPPPLQDLCLRSSPPCLAQHHVGPLWRPPPFQFGGVRCLGPGGKQQQCVETWVRPSPFLWRCSECLGVPQRLCALTASKVTGLKRQLLVTQPTPIAPLTHLYLYRLCMYTHCCSQPLLTTAPHTPLQQH